MFTSCCQSPMFQSTRPRGARPPKGENFTSLYLFQSTRPRGARHRADSAELNRLLFQSTRPRGARPGHRAAATSISSFNPRARVGRDMSLTSHGRKTRCFNPRARVGRDIRKGFEDCQRAEFQSTRPRGARLRFYMIGRCMYDVSIHAPAWGATCPWLRSSR